MTTTITQNIVSASVVSKNKEPVPEINQVQKMHESVVRPERLTGATYKIKTPLSEHALYVTINDVVLNPGTPDEIKHPFEVFINSKAMDQFQWIVGLTRVVSAVFRKGGECAFLIEELKSVFDPKGGYFKKGGKYMPSLVAEIGEVLEQHLTGLGLYQRDVSLVEAAQEMVAKKLEKTGAESKMLVCQKCNQQSALLLDNCLTCTNPECLYSKCG